MRIIEEEKLNVLIPDNGYILKQKDDNYIPRSENEDGSVIEEYIPYYFDKAYVPKNMPLETLEEMYEEVKIEDTNLQ